MRRGKTLSEESINRDEADCLGRPGCGTNPLEAKRRWSHLPGCEGGGGFTAPSGGPFYIWKEQGGGITSPLSGRRKRRLIQFSSLREEEICHTFPLEE